MGRDTSSAFVHGTEEEEYTVKTCTCFISAVEDWTCITHVKWTDDYFETS